MAPGTYVVEIAAHGYIPAMTNVTVPEDGTGFALDVVLERLALGRDTGAPLSTTVPTFGVLLFMMCATVLAGLAATRRSHRPRCAVAA